MPSRKPKTATTALAVQETAAATVPAQKTRRRGHAETKASRLGIDQQQEARRISARDLRAWSRRNEWVRIAINRRKRQISQARWQIVRLDDEDAAPNPQVVDAIKDLLNFVNPLEESFRELMDMVIEDLLVLDAGCIELVRRLGEGVGDGPIAHLYAVDGATIVPVKDWDGTDPSAPRYEQEINNRVRARFRSDQMIYMKATPTTYSRLGWSPVETVYRSIEADLFGDEFDLEMLRQTQPSGMMDLGSGYSENDVDAFREYWQEEIEGRRRIAINGGGEVGRSAATFVSMGSTSEDVGREKYRIWIATKIAAVFEMDLGVFNLTANLHKDTGGHQQALTDEGHRTLGTLVQEYITRRIVRAFDKDHAFRFQDLNARDAADQAKLDDQMMAMGATTPNEVRARDGRDPLPWGDAPFIKGKGPWSGGSALGSKPDDESAPAPDELLDDVTETVDDPKTEDPT